MTAPSQSRAIAREARKLIRDAGAKLSGRQRGHDPVHRHSYDIDDPRANVFRRVGDGTLRSGLGWVDDYVRLAEEYDIINKKKGERSPLMANGIRVLKAMLQKFMDFKTGQLDPALVTLQAATGLSKNAIVDALKRLKRHGFLDWIRRSEKTGNNREAGPQRKQATNAYFFNLNAMAKAVRARFLNLQEARRRRLANKPPATNPTPLTAPATAKPLDAALEAVLKRLEAGVEARV